MLSALACFAILSPAAAGVHSVTDIAHDFNFYMDGRFATQYLPGGRDARCWRALSKVDYSNVNLLIVSSGATPCVYTSADLSSMKRLIGAGGGVAVLGDLSKWRDGTYTLNTVANAFGASFTDVASKTPIKTTNGTELTTYGGKTIELKTPKIWQTLAVDADGKIVAAQRSIGKGKIMIASRGLFGRNPDASDAINAEFWRPLLGKLGENKPVDAARAVPDGWVDNVSDHKGLKLRYSDYMGGFAKDILAVYDKCRPAMEEILGVPPSPNMMTSLILLPTGGGGFSDGTNIALGVWWGDFPKEQYGMVELLGHEGTHSWVLPFPEPMWNEGIATYVGILLGKKLGLDKDADATLKGWIDGAMKEDPDMTKFDLAQGKGVPHQVGMAKPMWIFEQLRKEKPDIVARYFRAKRRLISADAGRYTADDSVAVLSVAAGRDLFPWFKSLGITVDRSRTTIR